jgi:hypothetical protein
MTVIQLRGYPRARIVPTPRMFVAALRVWGIVLGIRIARALPSGRRPGNAPGGTTMNALDAIRAEVLGWTGVTEEPHRFGGVEFRLGKRELGHLHGDYLADLPFPVRVREELVAHGRAMPHHILPQSGWISYPIRDASAIPGAIDLFRLAYERATAKRGKDG